MTFEFHDVPQLSEQWFQLRIGVATSSCFGKIITPKTGKLSASASEYASLLIAEKILGEPLETFKQTYWMERGQEYEPMARKAYVLETDYDIDGGGFISNGMVGSSPDARVFNGDLEVIGAAEIKCPAPWTHVENLCRDEIDPKYIPQVQGQIFCGRKLYPKMNFVDWFSFHPEMPMSLIRTTADAEYQGKLDVAIGEFEDIMKEKIDTLIRKGVIIHSEEGKAQAAPDAVPEDILMAG